MASSPESRRQRRTTKAEVMALVAECERNGTGEPAHTEATRYIAAPPKVRAAITAFAANAKAREIARQPRVSESVKTIKAVRAALAKFRTDKLHPLLEAAHFVAGTTAMREAIYHLGAGMSLVADDPKMRHVLGHADRAMRLAREANRQFDRSRPCEDRLHLQRSGRAPRRRTNTKRHGSRRAEGIRTGQDPGGDDPPGEADPDHHLAPSVPTGGAA